MKIALLGYGKMGKEIEQMAISRSHTIHCIVDNEQDWTVEIEKLKQCDVAIEFSTPANVVQNVQKCFALNLPVVVGTTGWYNELEKVQNECIQQKQSLFVASNFSIGVNIFFRINKQLAKLMNEYPDYKVEMTEIHHTAKLDAPSGTAVTLAADIITELDRKNSWTISAPASETELYIHPIREGNVPGTHSVTYSSEIDELTICHLAKSRKGFALGAVLAAEFLQRRKGFFGMNDLLEA